MNSYGLLPVSLLNPYRLALVFAFGVAMGGSSAAFQGYESLGFLQNRPPSASPASAPTGPQPVVDQIVTGRWSSPSAPDLAMRYSNGRVIINRRASQFGEYLEVAGTFTAVTNLPGATEDMLVATDGTGLFQIVWDWPAYTAIPVAGMTSAGGRFLRAVELEGPPGATGLLSIRDDGTAIELHLYDTLSGTWSTVFSRVADSAQGEFHEAVLMDWDGLGGSLMSDEVIAISDRGLEFLPLDSSKPASFLSALPDGAFLNTIPASGTNPSRDLLIWGVQLSAGGPEAVIVARSGETETLYTPGWGVEDAVAADLAGPPDGLLDLVLSREDERTVVVFPQSVSTQPGDDVFINSLPSGLTTIAMAGALGSGSSAPARPLVMACGDMDGDGDDDLVAIDDVGRIGFLPSQLVGEEDLRIRIDSYSVVPQLSAQVAGGRELSYTCPLTLPAGADGLRYEVYYQPDLTSMVDPAPLPSPSAGTVSGLQNGVPVDVLITATVAQPQLATEVFQIAVYPTSTSGASNLQPAFVHWSPDQTSNYSLSIDRRGEFPWAPPGYFDDLDVGVGTTRGPRIDPLGGGTGGGGGG